MNMRKFLSKTPGLKYVWRFFLRLQRSCAEKMSYCKRWGGFERQFHRFKILSVGRGDLSVKWDDRFPCLDDNTGTTGFDRHYVFHTSWAARVLAQTKPAKHIDISSSLYFVGIASAFVPVDFYDYRPAALGMDNLQAKRGDLLQLPFADSSVQSLSCMHVVEHVGLGRYGDPMDVEGDIKAMRELQRVLTKGGTLLFVVPVGRPKVCFNAHRVYSYEQIISYFSDLTLKEFALIPDDAMEGGLLRYADPARVSAQSYGCGCFYFTKPV